MRREPRRRPPGTSGVPRCDRLAAMRPGRGRITVVPDLTAELGPSLEVEIRIAEGRALDLALAAELRRLPGVVAVTEL